MMGGSIRVPSGGRYFPIGMFGGMVCFLFLFHLISFLLCGLYESIELRVDVAETRKRFSGLYSMSSLVHYEEFVDHCADIFSQRLTEYAQREGSLNLGHWFQCYAFDVIGEITFGKRFGEYIYVSSGL